MRHFVCGEEDSGVLEQALCEQVPEGVIFFVEGEDGGVGDAWGGRGLVWARNEGERDEEDVRVSAFSSTFSWPSSRRKSSNLEGERLAQGHMRDVMMLIPARCVFWGLIDTVSDL